MNNIIVTLTDKQETFHCDIQVPADQHAEELAEDILHSLQAYDPSLYPGKIHARIFFPAENRFLGDEETFASAGIWDGEVIYLL